MTSTPRRYHDAAVGYFLYGVLYLAGAIYLAQVGASPRSMGAGSVWWFLMGGAMVALLPVLIWKEFKWITRLLAILVFVRVVGLTRLLVRSEWDPVPLPGIGEISQGYGAAVFFGVSLFACSLLVRAGWGTWYEKIRSKKAA